MAPTWQPDRHGCAACSRLSLANPSWRGARPGSVIGGTIEIHTCCVCALLLATIEANVKAFAHGSRTATRWPVRAVARLLTGVSTPRSSRRRLDRRDGETPRTAKLAATTGTRPVDEIVARALVASSTRATDRTALRRVAWRADSAT